MKIEGELAFFHSNIGCEPESESFEFNDNDLDSTGYKLQNQKMKEYENRVSIDLKRNERDLDLSSYDVESADCLTTPKLDFLSSMIDSKNDYEAQVRDFVEPVSHAFKDMESFMKFPNDTESVKRSPTSPISNPLEEIDSFENSVDVFEPVSHASKDMESFMKFPNDIESVKRSPTSPISDPLEEIDSFENSMDVYMDKTVTECEPELIVCYKEGNYHLVKDICVDEGVLTKDKVLFENSVDEKAYNFFPSESYEDKEIKKDNIGINVLNLPATEESDQVSANHDQSKDLMHKDEVVKEKLFGNVNKETLPGEKVLLQELDTQESRASDDDGEQVSGDPELPSQAKESKNMVEEAVLASPTLASAVDESNSDSLLLENGSFTYEFDPSAPAVCGKEECHQVGDCKCDETQNTPKPVDGKSDDQAITSQVRYSLGESSFSAVGPVSSRISYSGPVPYSGSISLRSDSSTTSTRSFAFPILQSEWNSSPVRMAKADRSNFRKHRGWRQGLLCCKF